MHGTASADCGDHPRKARIILIVCSRVGKATAKAWCLARRELAQHYLLHSSLELNETAYLLGYEDANSFFRAFHQWEGTSPGKWRTVHAHRASSNHASAPVASSTL